jgi:hypothetical protein
MQRHPVPIKVNIDSGDQMMTTVGAWVPSAKRDALAQVAA